MFDTKAIHFTLLFSCIYFQCVIQVNLFNCKRNNKKKHTVGTVWKCKKYEHVLAFKTNMLRNDTITNSKERYNVLYA